MFCSESYTNDSGKSNIASQADRDTEKCIRLEKRRAIRPKINKMEIMELARWAGSLKDPFHIKMKDCKEDFNFASLTSGKRKTYYLSLIETKPAEVRSER